MNAYLNMHPGVNMNAYERDIRGCKFAPGCKYERDIRGCKFAPGVNFLPGANLHRGANCAHEHGFSCSMTFCSSLEVLVKSNPIQMKIKGSGSFKYNNNQGGCGNLYNNFPVSDVIVRIIL